MINPEKKKVSNVVNAKKIQWFFILEKVDRICELSNITGDQELQNNGMLFLLKILFLN